jgi:hypothetical protein
VAGARRVGVDVERIAARVRYPAIARASFTAAECDAGRDLRGFFTAGRARRRSSRRSATGSSGRRTRSP